MSASVAKAEYVYKTFKCGYTIDVNGNEHPLSEYPEVEQILNGVLRESFL